MVLILHTGRFNVVCGSPSLYVLHSKVLVSHHCKCSQTVSWSTWTRFAFFDINGSKMSNKVAFRLNDDRGTPRTSTSTSTSISPSFIYTEEHSFCDHHKNRICQTHGSQCSPVMLTLHVEFQSERRESSWQVRIARWHLDYSSRFWLSTLSNNRISLFGRHG